MTYVATATPNTDCHAGTTITIESSITATDAASAIDATHLVLMVMHRTVVAGKNVDAEVGEVICWNAGKLQANIPLKVHTPFNLVATLAPGTYWVSASVRDLNWHWLPVTQIPVLFNVLAAVTGPKPLRAVPGGYLPDDGVNYALIPGASDDFLGTTLDRSKWWTRYKDNNGTLDHYGNEVGRYIDNHIVANGELLMPAKIRPNTIGYQTPDGRIYELRDTSMIRSRTIVERGYFEAKIWVPPGQGFFPAFWLLPQYQWPPEIDIMECAFDGGIHEKNTMVHGCEVSGGPSNPSVIWHDPGFNTQYNYLVLPQPVAAGYHHYALLWEADKVTEWFDAKPICQKKFSWLTNGGTDGGLANVIINLAVGGGWATLNYTQPIDKADQVMKVDFVHVYQRADSIKTGVSPL